LAGQNKTRAAPIKIVANPAPKRNLVGPVAPGLGTPLSVEGILLLAAVGIAVGEGAVGVGDKAEVGETVPVIQG